MSNFASCLHKAYTMDKTIDIELTADGSPTLYRADLDEHYHSVKGALAESLHVYIELGFAKAAEIGRDTIRIFEVGYGTGLNAALTLGRALKDRVPTHYYSVELYPLARDIADSISAYMPEDVRLDLAATNEAEWNKSVELNQFFSIEKISGDLLTLSLPSDLDVVYFDAFAPEKQPELWSIDIFRKFHDAMCAGGILTTYCAKGKVRRMLQEVGFRVERMPGPPGGKREVLRATKL